MAKFEAGYANENNNAPVKASSVNYTQSNSWVPAKEAGTENDSTQPARNWLDGIYGAIAGQNSNGNNIYGWKNGQQTSIKYPTFQPKTYSMNYININDSYNISKFLTEEGNIYGLNNSTTDSHLIKNSEWGAVAYLAQSKYENNGTEPYINNLSLSGGNTKRTDDISGGTGVNSVYAVTGVTTGSTSAGGVATTIDKINGTTGNTANTGVYTWNQETGQKPSSTLNMYGVFDMSGGFWERTAGYISNGNWNLTGYGSSFTKEKASTKYATVYPRDKSQDDSSKSYDTSTTEKSNQVYATLGTANYKTNKYIYGDAIKETSTSGTSSTSWNGDYSYFPALGDPFTIRGGHYWSVSAAGLFYFYRTNGSSTYTRGFRSVLIAL